MNDLDNTIFLQIRNDSEYLVREASKILAKYQKEFSVVQMKDTVDLATTADIASEKFITDFIRNKYPEHEIYSEEAGQMGKTGDFLWIIDPLDGTKEFVRGLGEYNCLIAIEYKDQLSVCAMYRNGVNELYSAMSHYGASGNNQTIRVSGQTDLSHAFIGFHVPNFSRAENEIDLELKVLGKFVRTCYRVRPGWDDAHYSAWVARGVLDAHVVSANVNKWYDIASGILLVEEAGGKVTDWEGNPIKNHNLDHGIVLSNGIIHETLIELINK